MREARRILTELLLAGGVEDASFDSRQLLQHVLGVDAAGLLTLSSLSEGQWEAVQQLAKRRITGEPLQYLLGSWDFYGRTFTVGPGVLIPRADTEVLCETALGFLQHRPCARIADLCAGSGCIAVTLERETNGSTVWALEASEQALDYLTRNIHCNHSAVQAVQDDVLCPSFGETGLDLIVSNPPYLNEADLRKLQREVRYEPEMALYAPENGLLFYRRIPEIWKQRLQQGGMLCFEVGIGQAAAVAALLQQNGFASIAVIRDYQGIERVVSGIRID